MSQLFTINTRIQGLLIVMLIAVLLACGGGGEGITSASGETDNVNDNTPGPEPLPAISVADASILEGDNGTGNILFTVSLDIPANGYVDVSYATADGSATSASNDYISTNGSLTIAPGFTSATISFNVIGDTVVEGNETFTLTLSNPSANVTQGNMIATGTIQNDESPVEPPPGLPDQPRGIISTSGKGQPINQDIIDNPHVTGFMVLDGWNDIETSEGVFNWAHIDSEVARAKIAGKIVRLAIHAGGDSAPAWIFQNYPEVKQVIWYDKTTGDTEWLPAYWDPTYIEIKRRFYEALGNRYKNEPAVFAISASMVDPNTGDWSFIAVTDEQIQSYLDSGFTETRFIEAHKTVLDYGMAAFENKYVVTAVGPVPLQLVNDKYFAVHQVLDYAYATYGNRLIIAKGSLHAATPAPVDLPNNNAWQTILKYAPNAAGQFVWSTSNDPEFKMNGRAPYSEDQAGDIFWSAVENGKNYNLRWIEPWSIDILNPDLQDEIIAAALLLSSD